MLTAAVMASKGLGGILSGHAPFAALQAPAIMVRSMLPGVNDLLSGRACASARHDAAQIGHQPPVVGEGDLPVQPVAESLASPLGKVAVVVPVDPRGLVADPQDGRAFGAIPQQPKALRSSAEICQWWLSKLRIEAPWARSRASPSVS